MPVQVNNSPVYDCMCCLQTRGEASRDVGSSKETVTRVYPQHSKTAGRWTY